MTDDRFLEVAPLAENAAGIALHSGPISARPPKRRNGTRAKKTSALSIVVHTGRFQAQLRRVRPAKTARVRRIVS